MTVILPAAGKGSRLNLPYPKEILRINEDKALIDFSFDLFDTVSRHQVEFVVVINEEKTEIVRYLAKYKNRFDISFIYQKPDSFEYTGAIKSAKYLFSENNLVLLPDTLLTLPKRFNLLQTVEQRLQNHEFTFLVKPETNKKMLKTKGCLQLDKNMCVVAYEDKPSNNLSRFNGYWCGFAFKQEAFDQSIDFMEQSTLRALHHHTLLENTPIFKSSCIEIKDFKDLGTWDEITKFLSQQKA
ncbi:sugar phosphate nucleotidyltransferase [Planktomarina temperata]|nr:sugar phosphate nucleotidyltransferase [Planktomarina temperata]